MLVHRSDIVLSRLERIHHFSGSSRYEIRWIAFFLVLIGAVIAGKKWVGMAFLCAALLLCIHELLEDCAQETNNGELEVHGSNDVQGGKITMLWHAFIWWYTSVRQ